MNSAYDLVVLQTCLPDYRLPFYEQLIAAFGRTLVLCGKDYFTAGVVISDKTPEWCVYGTNRFIFGKRFLWQFGVISRCLKADFLIVELNPRILSTWAILVLRRARNRPTLVWGHLWGRHGSSSSLKYTRLAMIGLGRGMICYSRSQAAELTQILTRYRTWVASNSCVEHADCEPAASLDGAKCVTYVGRLIESKKPRVLLEAFARAVEKIPQTARLVLVGDGEETKSLRRRIEELGLVDRVDLPGHINDKIRLKEIYARTIVAVSPGYVGLSAIQCMANGIPMIVSRDEPHSPEIEACIEDQTCVFFDTDRVEDLADKIVGFYVCYDLWHSRQREIASFIRNSYTYEVMVEAFFKAFNDTRHDRQESRGERIGLVWAQFGPYHFARHAALVAKYKSDRVVAIEIADKTSIYAWRRESEARSVITLISGETVEHVSALRVYRSAVRVFLKYKIKVVLVPSYWPASSVAILLAAKSVGAKAVMMNDSHALTAKATGFLAILKQWLVLQFDAALVAGAPHKEYFSRLGMKHIVLGYDAVDNDFFKDGATKAISRANELRIQYGLPPRYFINVGRMESKKNLETLIDAYKLVRERLGDECPRLVFVGSGKKENVLRNRCIRHGFAVLQLASSGQMVRPNEADVIFMGFRQVEELPLFYALALAFVLPSREEEWGLVVNEAMACGLPVLVSRAAGCAQDLVRPGENGFLFDPMDAIELADYLERIIRDPKLAVSMGAASQQIIADWGCERFAEGAKRAVEIVTSGKK